MNYEEMLRKAAKEIRAADLLGWGNACEWGADRIAALEAALCRAIGIERDQIDDVLHMTAGTNSVSVSSKSASETKPLVRAESKSQQRRFEVQGIPHLPYEPETGCDHDLQHATHTMIVASYPDYQTATCRVCGARFSTDVGDLTEKIKGKQT